METDSKSPTVRRATSQAIKAMGTNLNRTVLAFLESRESSLKLGVNQLLDQQKMIRFRFTTAAERHAVACNAILILGGADRRAVPRLLELTADPKISGWASFAVHSISRSEPDTYRWVLQGLTNGPLEIQLGAVRAFDFLGFAILPTNTSSILIPLLKHPDMEIRRSAVNLLGQMYEGEASTNVIALISAGLQDQQAPVRAEAAWALCGLYPLNESVRKTLAVLLTTEANPAPFREALRITGSNRFEHRRMLPGATGVVFK